MTDFSHTRSLFHLPSRVTYLDGNSLGPLPRAAVAALKRTLQDEWGELLIRGWTQADWIGLPTSVGDRIGRLIGAPQGTVTMGDTLSIKVLQAVAAALSLNPKRRVVLSDTGNFPTDLYMVQGLIQSLRPTPELRLVEPEAVADSLDESVAVLMLTEVDYRTGRKHDMAAVTQRAQALGIVTVWDLAHSAGAFPVDVTRCSVDFAVGCTYKYLNGGPGAPAFIYVSSNSADRVVPVLSGWMGHQAPFAFDLDYRPARGIDRFRVGTPPVIALRVLEASLDIWDQVALTDVRSASVALGERFIAGVEAHCPMLSLVSPRDPELRGSQVSFRFHEGYAVMQALIQEGVIGDFRAPDIIRFGFAPLYNTVEDVDRAVSVLSDILATARWDKPQYKIRAAVT